MRKLNWLKTLVAATMVGTPATLAYAQDDLTDVTVALGWLRNGQYSAVLAADAAGYFEEQGIDLHLIDGGPGENPVSKVGVGQADFGITGSSYIFFARLAPAPIDIVAIGAMMQKTPYAYITLADPSDPEPTPQDMEGKTIGVQTDGEVYLKAIAEKNDLDLDTMEIKIVQGGLEPLLVGAVDFISGHIHNQPYQVELEASKPDAPENIKGKTWKAVRMSEYGVPSYNNVVFTTDETLREKPELVRKFLRAIAQGMKLMQENPEKVAQIVTEYPGQVETADKIKWRLPIMNELNTSADTAEHGFMWMRPEVWADQMAFYQQSGKIPRVAPPEEVMTNEFNPGIKSN